MLHKLCNLKLAGSVRCAAYYGCAGASIGTGWDNGCWPAEFWSSSSKGSSKYHGKYLKNGKLTDTGGTITLAFSVHLIHIEGF